MMKKILYVEDYEDTANAAKTILSEVGFDVKIAPCGKDALKVANEGFDLILLDIMLPDMSGWDVLQALQKRNIKTKYAFISVIPVTSERVAELKRSGISDYITKPFRKEDLISRVKNILG